MRTRHLVILCLSFGLIASSASAKSTQKKPHAVGSHPKPNHPVSKYKPKKQKKIKTKPHSA
jgi:hypothetical protein